MVSTIKIPDPTLQHTKTPVTVTKIVDVIVEPEKVEQKPVDPEKPELGTVEVTVPAKWGKGSEKVQLTTGTGETAKIVKFSELSKAVDDAKLTTAKTIAGVPVAEIEAQVIVKDTVKYGEWGLGCPKACGRFFEFRVNSTEDGYVPKDPAAWTPRSPKILEEADVDVTPQKPMFDKDGKPIEEPVGGLGEEEQVEKVFKHMFLIEYDDGRVEWVDVVPVTYGYLDWRPVEKTISFVCDRCGEKITLTSPS